MPAACVVEELCDAVVEDITGGVDAGAEGIDVLGVVVPAVGDTVIDVDG